MSEKNLLIVIIDTNPFWWALQSSNLLISNDSTNVSNKDIFNFNDFMSAVVAFLNAFKIMSQKNAVYLIAAHNTKSEYLYPAKMKMIDKHASPWDKYEQISDIDLEIKENLKNLCDENLQNIDKDNVQNDSLVTSALGLALCNINYIQRKFTFPETVNYRILIIKGSEDSSNQYMNFMNMIFGAEKLNVTIDSCALLQDSSLLQQASSLTNGFYFKINQLSALLNYLLWLFLPDESTRKMLVYPPKTHVDFRAACFCHRKLVDIGYVCSVCLSVFCSFTPICSTCNSNFQIDLKMLKKASILKNSSLTKQRINSSEAPFPKSQNPDDYQRLTSQFKDTSLSSPAVLKNESPSSNESQLSRQQQSSVPQKMNAKIITVNTSIQPKQARKEDLNDSLDMLE